MVVALDEQLNTVSALEFRIYVLKEQNTMDSLRRAIALEEKLNQIVSQQKVA